jgi:hypothetical protein
MDLEGCFGTPNRERGVDRAGEEARTNDEPATACPKPYRKR